MPGLSGLIQSSPLDDPAALIGRMQTVQKMPGCATVGQSFADAHAAIAFEGTGLLPGASGQPARDRDHVLFIEGEVFEIAGRAPEQPERIAERLLKEYLDHGVDFVDRLNGEFNVLIYEPRSRRLRIFADHMSSRPMYYWGSSGAFAFGSEKKSLLSVLPGSPEVDETGLLQLIIHDNNTQGRTFIKDVWRMPPGTHLTFESGRVQLREWFRLEFGTGFSGGYGDAVEVAAQELRSATERRSDATRPIVLTLSGGLDSRAVAATLPRQQRPVATFTISVDGAPEAVIAAELAERLSFDHTRLEPGVKRFSDAAPMVAWRTEGETSLRNTIGSMYHREMKARGDFMAGGWLAECASGQIMDPLMVMPASKKLFPQACYADSQKFGRGTLERVLTKEILDRNADSLRESYMASWSDIDRGSNIDRYHRWFLTERAIRSTNGSMAVDSHLFEKIRPFYDRAYLEATAPFPWRYRLGQLFYKSVIHRVGPELRDMPDSRYGHPFYAGWLRNFLALRVELSAWASQKVIRSLQRRTTYAPLPDGAIDPGALVRADGQLRQDLETFLKSSDCDDSIFNPAGTRQLLSEHYDQGLDHSALILWLTVLYRSLGYLVYRRPTGAPEELG